MIDFEDALANACAKCGVPDSTYQKLCVELAASPVQGATSDPIRAFHCTYPNCGCIGGGLFKPCVNTGEYRIATSSASGAKGAAVKPWEERIKHSVDVESFAAIDAAKNAEIAELRAALADRSPAVQPVAWLPTAENVNALPEGVRRYVHDLVARCDPAGEVAALTGLRDQLDGVQIMYRKAADALEEVRKCFDAAEAEGLSNVLAETPDERLKDLVERRVMYALYAAQGIATPTPEQPPLTPMQALGEALKLACPPLNRGEWATFEAAIRNDDEQQTVHTIGFVRGASPAPEQEAAPSGAVAVVRDTQKDGVYAEILSEEIANALPEGTLLYTAPVPATTPAEQPEGDSSHVAGSAKGSK